MSELFPAKIDRAGALVLPNIVSREGERTAKRFLEFFAANIRNENTRAAYARAVSQFLDWLDRPGVTLASIEPMVVAAYVERLTKEREPQTVKQHLAAIRMLFDWMVVGQAMPFNPASSVRGPRYSIKKGKTPVLSAKDARRLLDSRSSSITSICSQPSCSRRSRMHIASDDSLHGKSLDKRKIDAHREWLYGSDGGN